MAPALLIVVAALVGVASGVEVVFPGGYVFERELQHSIHLARRAVTAHNASLPDTSASFAPAVAVVSADPVSITVLTVHLSTAEAAASNGSSAASSSGGHVPDPPDPMPSSGWQCRLSGLAAVTATPVAARGAGGASVTLACPVPPTRDSDAGRRTLTLVHPDSGRRIKARGGGLLLLPSHKAVLLGTSGDGRALLGSDESSSYTQNNISSSSSGSSGSRGNISAASNLVRVLGHQGLLRIELRSAGLALRSLLEDAESALLPASVELRRRRTPAELERLAARLGRPAKQVASVPVHGHVGVVRDDPSDRVMVEVPFPSHVAVYPGTYRLHVSLNNQTHVLASNRLTVAAPPSAAHSRLVAWETKQDEGEPRMLVARVRLADGLNNTAGMAEAVHLVRAVLGGRQLPCAGNGSAGADDDTLLVECELGTAGGTVRFALLSVPIAGGSVVVASTASGSSGQDNLGAHGGLYIVVLCLGVLVLIVLVLGVVALRRRTRTPPVQPGLSTSGHVSTSVMPLFRNRGSDAWTERRVATAFHNPLYEAGGAAGPSAHSYTGEIYDFDGDETAMALDAGYTDVYGVADSSEHAATGTVDTLPNVASGDDPEEDVYGFGEGAFLDFDRQVYV